MVPPVAIMVILGLGTDTGRWPLPFAWTNHRERIANNIHFFRLHVFRDMISFLTFVFFNVKIRNF
jgi:hypothetical protein